MVSSISLFSTKSTKQHVTCMSKSDVYPVKVIYVSGTTRCMLHPCTHLCASVSCCVPISFLHHLIIQLTAALNLIVSPSLTQRFKNIYVSSIFIHGGVSESLQLKLLEKKSLADSESLFLANIFFS